MKFLNFIFKASVHKLYISEFFIKFKDNKWPFFINNIYHYIKILNQILRSVNIDSCLNNKITHLLEIKSGKN